MWMGADGTELLEEALVEEISEDVDPVVVGVKNTRPAKRTPNQDARPAKRTPSQVEEDARPAKRTPEEDARPAKRTPSQAEEDARPAKRTPSQAEENARPAKRTPRSEDGGQNCSDDGGSSGGIAVHASRCPSLPHEHMEGAAVLPAWVMTPATFSVGHGDVRRAGRRWWSPWVVKK
ncbi:hypothetical protein LR48_Vigan644s000200 [Vigna angularis]|uniref:Uncharacterized protein n=1 Tax=Phaseolus angularis TaxID=3914 RepID=A0A0L9TGT6_PHAAN|nr:hypothetical protein LR48_Vigan644s000200 [Vigna angularis]